MARMIPPTIDPEVKSDAERTIYSWFESMEWKNCVVLHSLGIAQHANTEILRQYFINHPQSIDKYTFLQNSAFTHWVKEKCSKMC